MRSLILAALLAATPALAQQSMSPEGASVTIISPENGATVSSPVTVVFGIEGMEVAPAGTEMMHSGHHHLLIDRPPMGEAPDDDLMAPLPADEHHQHFGGGQTEVSLDLAPGPHSLQLVLGDHNHIPHDPPVVSEVITITVE